MSAGLENLRRQVTGTTVRRSRPAETLMTALAVAAIFTAGVVVPLYVWIRFWPTAPEMVRQIFGAVIGGWTLTGLAFLVWRESG